MDSSNADPWEGFTGQSQADADDALITDPLVRQISELRAALADSEARRAELEAVLDAVRMRHHAKTIQTGSSTHGGPQQFGEVCSCGTFGCNLYRTIAVPSVVLEDRDREVAARALEEAADHYHGDLSLGPELRPVGWANRLRQRAAAIRKGDTNEHQG